MKKLMTALTIVFTALSIVGYSQEKKGKITGTVVDGSTKIVESATIALLRVKDSSVAKISVADKIGNFSFDGVPEGKYVVSITAVGHQKGFSESFEVTATNSTIALKTIELVPATKAL